MRFTVFIFKFVIFVYDFLLNYLIASHSEINDVFNIISCMKTSCTGMDLRYMLCTAQSVAASILAQGSYSSR